MGRGRTILAAATATTRPRQLGNVISNNMKSTIRLAWIDVARAICIILLLLNHFGIWIYPPTIQEYSDVRFWSVLNSALSALRMPLLFVLSGYLVSTRVLNGWRDRRNFLRVLTSIYLYAIWVSLYCIITLIDGTNFLPNLVKLSSYPIQFYNPQTPLWFIYYLALNVIIVVTTRKIPAWVVITGLSMVAVVVNVVDVPSEYSLSVRGLENMVYFAVGSRFPQLVRGIAERQLLAKFFGGVILFIGLGYFMKHFGDYRVVTEVVQILANLAAVGVGIVTASALSSIQHARAFLSYVGQRTLPIYLMHVPLLWLVLYIREWTVGEAVDNGVFRQLAPFAVSAVVIAVSIILAYYIRRARLTRWLLDVPAGMQNLILAGHRTNQ